MTDSLHKTEIACHAFGVTDQGRVRTGNEDAFLCNPDAGIFVVCDGMGGAAAGEVASRLAAEQANASLAAIGQLGQAEMRAAVAAANAAVFGQAAKDRRLEGMGTTLVMLALRGRLALVAHVGDSRCYLLRAGALSRLTADHSLVEEQVRLGQITRKQAERSSLQHVITRAIGTASQVQPDVQAVDVQVGDLFLLASDGLTKELDDAELEAMLTRPLAEEPAARALVDRANAAGGRDNVTCVLVRVL